MPALIFMEEVMIGINKAGIFIEAPVIGNAGYDWPESGAIWGKFSRCRPERLREIE